MTVDSSSKADENQSPEDDGQFKLSRGRLTSLNVYDVSEYELTLFEQGGSSSTALSFSTFLLSAAISFLIVILTVDLTSNNRLYFTFFIIVLVGFIIGIFMLLVWWRGHTSVKALGKTVRARLKGPS